MNTRPAIYAELDAQRRARHLRQVRTFFRGLVILVAGAAVLGGLAAGLVYAAKWLMGDAW